MFDGLGAHRWAFGVGERQGDELDVTIGFKVGTPARRAGPSFRRGGRC